MTRYKIHKSAAEAFVGYGVDDFGVELLADEILLDPQSGEFVVQLYDSDPDLILFGLYKRKLYYHPHNTSYHIYYFVLQGNIIEFVAVSMFEFVINERIYSEIKYKGILIDENNSKN